VAAVAGAVAGVADEAAARAEPARRAARQQRAQQEARPQRAQQEARPQAARRVARRRRRPLAEAAADEAAAGPT
jgi:hypothetical protein